MAAVVKGCCPLDCQDSCAWVATVEDGRVVRVEGAKAHPITRGTLCAKTNDYQTRTYAPDRILRPLRRIGPKGSGRFETVTWDEAIDVVATRFQELAREHGPETLAPMNYLGSMGVVARRAPMRLFHAMGASRIHGSICGGPGNVLEAEGHPRSVDPEEMVESRLIVLWGVNILTTCHHQWRFIEEARRRGARVVAIDPRRTRTAAACDEHLPVRPGGDAVLAAAIARVLLHERLADEAYAREVACDVDAFARLVEPWTPERAAGVCGVSPGAILALARAFGAARPALIRAGIAPQATRGGEDLVRGLSALAILGGHWQLPGGGLFIETSPLLDEARAARPDLAPRPGRSLDLARMGEWLTDPDLAPPVHGLMVWGTNPAVVQPDARRVRAGLAREDLFTVVLEHFLTDTARYADVVLPATTQLEHFDIQGAWGHQYVSVNHPAVPPVGEARSHGEIMRLLARRMGLRHEALHESDEEIAASALPPGVELSELKARGWIKHPPPRADPRRAGGRLRLVGAGGVPSPPQPPAPGLLQLLAPKSHYFMNSSFSNMPRHRRSTGGPVIEMHPEDARARGLQDGTPVVVRNSRGETNARVRLTDAIAEGVAALPGKWWATEAQGGDANALTPSAWTPGGQPAYNDTFVEVTRA